MQNGRVTRFLNRCLRLDQCWFDENYERYVFDPYPRRDVYEAYEETLFVYPRERRIWFLATREVWKGEGVDVNGYYYDGFDSVVIENVDKKNLSSEEAAKMLYEYLTRHEDERIVSKRSLRLLR